MSRRPIFLGLAAAALLLAACTSSTGGGSNSTSSSGSPSPTNTVEMPTASYSPPADASVTPPEQITLSNVQPNDGIAPIQAFLRSAKKSIDISVYRIDSDYDEVVNVLAEMVKKGIPVRISVSRQLIGQPNPPEGSPQQVQVQQDLQALGIDVQFSRPEFHYGHEKCIIIDGGTADGKAMIADWNLQASYFGANAYGPVGARGMAVLDTNPQDVQNIYEYFNANWPPFKPYPVSTRASLVWSPSGIEYQPVGNSVEVLTNFINNAKTSLDIYAEYIQDDAFLIPMIEAKAKSGVVVRMVGNSDGQTPAIVEQLRAAGIQIRFDPIYDGDTTDPMFVHSKTMWADFGTEEQVAFFGSQNTFINESPEAILELGTIVKNREAIEKAHAFFEQDFQTATETQASPSPAPSSSSAPASSSGSN